MSSDSRLDLIGQCRCCGGNLTSNHRCAPPAGSMRAEVRIQRSITDEYDSFLVLICHGKSYPYMHIPDDMPDDVLKHALEKLNA